jgi:hypothetical protein
MTEIISSPNINVHVAMLFHRKSHELRYQHRPLFSLSSLLISLRESNQNFDKSHLVFGMQTLAIQKDSISKRLEQLQKQVTLIEPQQHLNLFHDEQVVEAVQKGNEFVSG